MGKRRKRSESERACLDLAGNSKYCSIASVPRKEGGLRLVCLVYAGTRSGVVGLKQLGVSRCARQGIYSPTSLNRFNSCWSTEYSKTEQSKQNVFEDLAPVLCYM